MAIERIDRSAPLDRPDNLGNPQDPARRAPDASEPVESDRVDLSLDARRMGDLARAARELPEIRHEKVEELIGRLARGEYRVDTHRLARAILEFEDGLGH